MVLYGHHFWVLLVRSGNRGGTRRSRGSRTEGEKKNRPTYAEFPVVRLMLRAIDKVSDPRIVA